MLNSQEEKMKKLTTLAVLGILTAGISGVSAGPLMQNRDYYFAPHMGGGVVGGGGCGDCACDCCAPSCTLTPMEMVDGPCCTKVCCPAIVGFASGWRWF